MAMNTSNTALVLLDRLVAGRAREQDGGAAVDDGVERVEGAVVAEGGLCIFDARFHRAHDGRGVLRRAQTFICRELGRPRPKECWCAAR